MKCRILVVVGLGIKHLIMIVLFLLYYGHQFTRYRIIMRVMTSNVYIMPKGLNESTTMQGQINQLKTHVKIMGNYKDTFKVGIQIYVIGTGGAMRYRFMWVKNGIRDMDNNTRQLYCYIKYTDCYKIQSSQSLVVQVITPSETNTLSIIRYHQYVKTQIFQLTRCGDRSRVN